MSKEGRQELRGPTWSDKAGNCGNLNKMGFDMRWGQKQEGMRGDLKEGTFQVVRSVEHLGVSTHPCPAPEGAHPGGSQDKGGANGGYRTGREQERGRVRIQVRQEERTQDSEKGHKEGPGWADSSKSKENVCPEATLALAWSSAT